MKDVEQVLRVIRQSVDDGLLLLRQLEEERKMDELRQHPYRLSERGVRAGVWIDVGQWISTPDTRVLLVEESVPVIMRGTDSYTEAEARQHGWLLD